MLADDASILRSAASRVFPTPATRTITTRATGVSTRSMELFRSWCLEDEIRAGTPEIEWLGWSCETLAGAADGSPFPVGFPTREQSSAAGASRITPRIERISAVTLFTAGGDGDRDRTASWTSTPPTPPLTIRRLDAMTARALGLRPGSALLVRPDGSPSTSLDLGDAAIDSCRWAFGGPDRKDHT